MGELKNIIKARRLEKGLSQRQLAKMIGVTYTAVQNWEEGRGDILSRNLLRLLDALDVPPDQRLSIFQMQKEGEEV